MNTCIISGIVREYRKVQQSEGEFYELYVELETEGENGYISRCLIRSLCPADQIEKAFPSTPKLHNCPVVLQGYIQINSIQNGQYRRKLWTIHANSISPLKLSKIKLPKAAQAQFSKPKFKQEADRREIVFRQVNEKGEFPKAIIREEWVTDKSIYP